MGLPEMENFWSELIEKKKKANLNPVEEEIFDKLAKTLQLLRKNTKHPSLKSHEINVLTKKYGIKIWQSYIDQGKNARRIFWAYGPNRKEITILGIEPHPEDNKRGSYQRIKLSQMP
ncbi:MAG: hypothetical protein WD491_14550 [Balneolales bacterium]